jgi:hypothetical protein
LDATTEAAGGLNMSDDRCCFCGKPATKLCDFPVGYHPIIIDLPDDAKYFDNEGNDITTEVLGTCSRPICDDCAIQFRDMDICPHCMKELAGFIEESRPYLKKQRTLSLQRVYGSKRRFRS